MKTGLGRTIAGIMLGLAVFAFVTLGTFGLSQFGMSDANNMVNCPLMGMAALCQMNPLEHIASWQNMFSAALQRDASVFIILFLLALALSYLGRQAWAVKRKLPRISEQSVRPRSRLAPVIVPSLQEAFSSGILNPKIF